MSIRDPRTATRGASPLEPGSDEALAEEVKASVRAQVKHPFLKLKWLFGYGKVRCRGLAKNTQWLALLLGLGNLLTAEEGWATGSAESCTTDMVIDGSTTG